MKQFGAPQAPERYLERRTCPNFCPEPLTTNKSLGPAQPKAEELWGVSGQMIVCCWPSMSTLWSHRVYGVQGNFLYSAKQKDIKPESARPFLLQAHWLVYFVVFRVQG